MTEKAKRAVEAMRRRLHEGRKARVLFVCLGNICRSPAAEVVLQRIVDQNDDQHRWLVDSAGTGNYHIGDLPDSRMRAAGSRRGYRFTHRCRQVHPDDFADFDIIIGMDAQNLRNLRLTAPTAEDADKVVAMAEFLAPDCGYDYVPDPYYEGAEGFELVLNLLEDGCSTLYKLVTE